MELPFDFVIKRGAILHNKTPENIDHGKFFVIMGESKDSLYGFFFINSKINDFIYSKKLLFDMQYPLRRTNYPSFLKHDSFLSCHEINKYKKSALIEDYKNGIVEHKGFLLDEDLEYILNACLESDLFSESEKNSFFK